MLLAVEAAVVAIVAVVSVSVVLFGAGEENVVAVVEVKHHLSWEDLTWGSWHIALEKQMSHQVLWHQALAMAHFGLEFALLQPNRIRITGN